MSTVNSVLQSSVDEEWYLKKVKFSGQDLKIITQNINGPCSFIAICNILILRGNIVIQPPTRKTVAYEFLSQLVADYLLTTSPDVDVSAALTIMPETRKGMDLNPVFTAATSFRPSGKAGGELKLFEQVGVPLVHGWLVDPNVPEAGAMTRVQNYDSAVQLIAEVDHLTNGRFVVDDDAQQGGQGGSSMSPASPTRDWTNEDLQKVRDATVVRRFLDTTQSQLTYHGLFHLAQSLPPNQPCALFRNSHLSVIYRHSPSSQAPASNAASSSSQPIPESSEDNSLYTLVTDQVFFNEPSVVWERLEDVDGGWSTFVDSEFIRASPAGGDFAGQTAEEALRASEALANQFTGIEDPADRALAHQLQVEEELMARREHDAYIREQQRRKQQEVVEQHIRELEKKKKSKKKDCLIM